MFKCREGEKDEGKKMVVIGGGITGMEAALFLRAQGNEVSVVDMLPDKTADYCGYLREYDL